MLIDLARFRSTRTAALPLIEPKRPLKSLQIGMRWLDSGSGGLDRVYFDLVNALPGQGIAVRGLVGQPDDVAVRTRGRVTPLAPGSTGLVSRLRIGRRTIGALCRSGNLDLVASHFALPLAPALDRLRDLPFIVHFHGPWAAESAAEGQGPLAVGAKKLLETRVYQRADRLIVLSRAFADLLTRDYGIAPELISIVPGGVDIARFGLDVSRTGARLQLGWPTDRPILLAVRRLAQRMGLDQLIAAMATIVKVEPTALLFIAGRGKIEGMLRAQVEALGLCNHVRFLGFLPEAHLPLAYRAADINVVPTTTLEGFGLTAAEALAAGTPSMVTPVGGLPEIVAGLSADLVFGAATVQDIAVGLSAALRGSLNIPNAEACRAYASGRFSVELAAARTATVYRRVAT